MKRSICAGAFAMTGLLCSGVAAAQTSTTEPQNTQGNTGSSTTPNGAGSTGGTTGGGGSESNTTTNTTATTTTTTGGTAGASTASTTNTTGSTSTGSTSNTATTSTGSSATGTNAATGTATTNGQPTVVNGVTQTNTVPENREDLKLNYSGNTYSLGARAWVMHIMPQIVQLLVKVNPDWGGTLGVATGLEFVYRSGAWDFVIGAMYTDYRGDAGYFRGKEDGDEQTERVEPALWATYLTFHALHGFRFASWIELQVGLGLGVGYLGGNLYRTQVYPGPGGTWLDCGVPGGPGGAYPDYCEVPSDNNGHFTNGANGRYSEPSFFNGGSFPTILPWLSLPHMALHIRPVHNLDFRLEGGFSWTGVYGGGAAHFVF